MARLGRIIRQYRQKQNMSQSELCDGICSRSHLSHIESGSRVPSPEVLAQLADRLRVPLCELADEYLQREDVSSSDYINLSRQLSSRGYAESARQVLEIPKGDISRAKVDAATWYRFERDYTDALAFWHHNEENYPQALALYRDHLEICRRHPSDEFYLARAHFLLGRGIMYSEGLKEAEGALLLAFGHTVSLDPQEAGVRPRRVIRLHERVVQCLLRVLIRLREHSVARDIYRMARLRWDELGILDSLQAPLRLGVARVHLGAGEIDRAHRIVKSIRMERLDPQDQQIYLVSLGLIYRTGSRIPQALGVLQEAWRLFEEHGGWGGRFIANEMARCHLQEDDYPGTRRWLDRADGTDDSHPFAPNPDEIARTLLTRARLVELTGEGGCLECFRTVKGLDLSKEARWGVSLEKLRCLLTEGASEEELDAELTRLERSLPGIFVL